jgi:hypothetical protein
VTEAVDPSLVLVSGDLTTSEDQILQDWKAYQV